MDDLNELFEKPQPADDAEAEKQLDLFMDEGGEAPQDKVTSANAGGELEPAGVKPEASDKPGIMKVSHKHRQIAHWMYLNPDKPLSACAVEFGMTQAWLSCVIHSQAFQDYLDGMDDTVVNTAVLPLREKLQGVAHRAVEKLGEAVDNSQDPGFILNVADKALHRLGYAPTRGPLAGEGGTVNQQTNFFLATKEDLAEARARMLEANSNNTFPQHSTTVELLD